VLEPGLRIEVTAPGRKDLWRAVVSAVEAFVRGDGCAAGWSQGAGGTLFSRATGASAAATLPQGDFAPPWRSIPAPAISERQHRTATAKSALVMRGEESDAVGRLCKNFLDGERGKFWARQPRRDADYHGALSRLDAQNLNRLENGRHRHPRRVVPIAATYPAARRTRCACLPPFSRGILDAP